MVNVCASREVSNDHGYLSPDVLDLQRDLGVNREGIGIILNLLDQVHGLRQALAGKVHAAEG